ncbi:succinate dehydrogenase, hydrophobic membrane anchor protein [Usitatibacter palustris]|uniref:Succinate dehydrogenase hydrophobic membrane anchor subunit n=1 Tax=Usitatibacter palustris TaxID=2732487 RepID=A0A6M4H860_9PROT|nr:succinate dehydrogenase, hydrophobic membrane anchor protein [Usitatibacter palustris]QJR14893.1 Succinate dehydrogenase hydrophobic membrane anchor subunit [Usitatibacter palustris]
MKNFLWDWFLQRATGAVMAIYTPIVVVCVLMHRPGTFADWKALFASAPMRVATLVFMIALLYHAWVGMRDIILDYVKPAGVRGFLKFAIAIALVAYLAWSVAILWGR